MYPYRLSHPHDIIYRLPPAVNSQESAPRGPKFFSLERLTVIADLSSDLSLPPSWSFMHWRTRADFDSARARADEGEGEELPSERWRGALGSEMGT